MSVDAEMGNIMALERDKATLRPTNSALLVEMWEMLTEEEHDAVLTEWQQYDGGLSGKVTKEQYRQGELEAWRNKYGQDVSAEELNQRCTLWFRYRDLDGDGEVRLEEFKESKALVILGSRGRLVKALSEEEIETARSLFKRIDTHCNGFIDHLEAREYFEAKLNKEYHSASLGIFCHQKREALVRKQMQNLFRADVNNDGHVTFEEFLANEAHDIVLDRHRKEAMAISEMDKRLNRAPSGISAAIMKAMSPDRLEHAEMMFKEHDSSGNGQVEIREIQAIFKKLNLTVSRREFSRLLKKAFKMADTDDDKSLTFEEFLPLYQWLYVDQLNFDVFTASAHEVEAEAHVCTEAFAHGDHVDGDSAAGECEIDEWVDARLSTDY